MNKVYSLDTYRYCKKFLDKTEAIKRSKIVDQQSLEQHEYNIQFIKAEETKRLEKKSISWMFQLSLE